MSKHQFPKQTPKQNKLLRNFSLFSGAAVQMGVTIYFFVKLGKWLDHNYNPDHKFYVVICTLSGVAIAFYMIIRMLKRVNSWLKMRSFTFKLAALLIFVFGTHLFILFLNQIPLFSHQLIKAYLINMAATIIIYVLIHRLKENHSSKLGFIFLLGSGLKFLLFFMIFYAGYKADNTITTLEFLTFFTPYATCLIFETYALSKELNQV